MSNYKIIPIQVGQFTGIEKSIFTYMTDPGQKYPCPVISYIIEGGGEQPARVLVDTGPCGTEWANKYHHGFVRPAEMELPRAMEAAGFRPEDMDFVIMTHLHWDHCFNTEFFPGKKIFVQKRELEYALDPLPMHAVSYEAPSVGLVQPWLGVKGQMVTLEGDTELLPGIRVVTLPGHSPGFQGVLVDTVQGKYLIAGDCLSTFENWEGDGRQKHIPGGVHVDLAEVYETYDKIEKICDFILPGHDPRVFEHECYPPEEQAEERQAL